MLLDQEVLSGIKVDPELAKRNEERLQQAKTALGTKYLLHPSHKITREKFRKTMRLMQKPV